MAKPPVLPGQVTDLPLDEVQPVPPQHAEEQRKHPSIKRPGQKKDVTDVAEYSQYMGFDQFHPYSIGQFPPMALLHLAGSYGKLSDQFLRARSPGPNTTPRILISDWARGKPSGRENWSPSFPHQKTPLLSLLIHEVEATEYARTNSSTTVESRVSETTMEMSSA
ncbi:Hypothetical predicted protein [Pelobates cultripes]|uniref:Uncharacterized protein n=1 Tax=Pelobates cultripes TaxID=61616 RepID=A0AAD1T589_PELCU|nr:Hypothetical predicted protein [Pelobates cultripes]